MEMIRRFLSSPRERARPKPTGVLHADGYTFDAGINIRRLFTPLVADLESWMREQRAKLSRDNDVAKAMEYMLKRWSAFTRFLDDGRICLSNNAAERALRGIAMLESLCIPFSSVCKHWNRVVVSDATRATFSGHRGFDRFRRQVVGANLVWRAGHNLHRGQHAGFDQAA